jgi:hypothetical protein
MPRHLFKFAFAMSLLIAAACLIAGVWIAVWPHVQTSPPPGVLILRDGWPVGNKELFGYRTGADVRLTSRPRLELILYPVLVPNAETRAVWDWNARWGGPSHWLKIPEFNVSLWWPFALSLIMPAFWLLRSRHRPTETGFPVMPARTSGD